MPLPHLNSFLSQKIQSVTKRNLNQINIQQNTQISNSLEKISKSLTFDVKRRQHHRNTIVGSGANSEILRQKTMKQTEPPRIDDKDQIKSSPVKLLGSQKKSVAFSLPRAEDIILDQGISDLKRPYIPDFGYTQYVNFEDESKIKSWGSLAKQILSYPKFEKLFKIIEEKSEQIKLMELKEKEQQKQRDGQNGMDRIRMSLRKWIFSKQASMNIDTRPLDKFHRKMLEVDAKYQGMKRDISMITTQTDTFDNYIQKIKNTPVSKVQLQLSRQDRLFQTQIQQSTQSQNNYSKSVDSSSSINNQDDFLALRNRSTQILQGTSSVAEISNNLHLAVSNPKLLNFERAQQNYSQQREQHDIDQSDSGPKNLSQYIKDQQRNFSNKFIRHDQMSVNQISVDSIERRVIAESLSQSKQKDQENIKVSQFQKQENYIDKENTLMKEKQVKSAAFNLKNQRQNLPNLKGQAALNFFSLQNQIIDKNIQRWSHQKDSIDSRISNSNPRLIDKIENIQRARLSSQPLNKWLKESQRSIPRQLGESVDYLKFLESRNQSNRLNSTSIKTKISLITRHNTCDGYKVHRRTRQKQRRNLDSLNGSLEIIKQDQTLQSNENSTDTQIHNENPNLQAQTNQFNKSLFSHTNFRKFIDYHHLNRSERNESRQKLYPLNNLKHNNLKNQSNEFDQVNELDKKKSGKGKKKQRKIKQHTRNRASLMLNQTYEAYNMRLN